MAYIKLTLDHALVDGEQVTFRAPCACNEVSGIKVAYPNLTESSASMTSLTFSLRDSHKNALTGLGNLFSAGATVHAVLDTTNKYAFILNADTNKYLENKFTALENKIIYSSSEPTGSKGKIWLKPV